MPENSDAKVADTERLDLLSAPMPTMSHAKFFIPDAKTNLIRGPDKINTDQGESDAPPMPHQVLLPGMPSSSSCIRPSKTDPVEP